jgi:hypothetical protein
MTTPLMFILVCNNGVCVIEKLRDFNPQIGDVFLDTRWDKQTCLSQELIYKLSWIFHQKCLSQQILHLTFFAIYYYIVLYSRFIFNVTSLMHENIEITKTETKESKQITHHPPNEYKSTLGKPNTRKT